jgi:uncharacterized protein RhaS with RHS repeats
LQSDPIGLAGGSYSTYAYVSGNPISFRDPFGLESGAALIAENQGIVYPGAGPGGARLPDYTSLQLDLYVLSVSATYTKYGDVFQGKGPVRQYLNPANIGVSISDGWVTPKQSTCDANDGAPTRQQLNSFLAGYSGGAGAYAFVGGSVSANPYGRAFNLGVGFGGVGVNPAIINSYQGNLFGEPGP